MKSTKYKRPPRKMSPYMVLILSFLGVILLGSVLLSLPIATYEGIHLSYLDALFLSTSASCVTGLSTVPSINDTFTIFGKVVFVVLMEIGGVSIVTLASFLLVVFGKKMGISSRIFLTNALNQNSQKGIINLLKQIVKISFIIQVVFIIINFFILHKYYPNLWENLGVAIFHTASSFNNAGFDIFGDSSMVAFHTDFWLNMSTMAMIVVGGLGFIVLLDIVSLPWRKSLSFHSKIVLLVTSILILVPAVIFRLTMNVSWLESFFTSITARTAGFSTVSFSEVMRETPSYPLMLVLMFIGASPGSTGGGIKTTTFFTILVTIVYAIFGKKPKAFKRSISEESILKSLTLIMLSVTYIIVLIMGLKAFEPSMSYNDLVFEAFSAFGTVGVSMGITPFLSMGSKILICITMFVGRLGPLTFVSFWGNNFMQESSTNVRYLEEKIIIG